MKTDSKLELFSGSPERPTYFCEVALPLPVKQSFTYRIPRDWEKGLERGMRIIVPFGKRKIYTGIALEIHQKPPQDYEARFIQDILDDTPTLTEQQLRFFQWMADYYMCSLGEVIRNALPSGLKLSSESRIQLRPGFSEGESDIEFSAEESIILAHLRSDKSLTYSQIEKLLQTRNFIKFVRSLLKKEAILLYEDVKEKYSPKTESRVRITKEWLDQNKLESLLNELDKQPKQQDVLLAYLQKVPVLRKPEANRTGCSKKKLLDMQVSASSVKTLTKNGILEDFSAIIPRIQDQEPMSPDHEKILTPKQNNALDEILLKYQVHDTLLLHGITGSGKTELYIQLIQKVLEQDEQALYLLPEIALTTHMVTRLRHRFGKKLGVYHSRFSDNERVEVWQQVQNGALRVVMGVRSAIFLPFDNLGLIVVDEEHENSFKQFDPAPRYHARDAAIVLGKSHHAKIILGSATPSLESKFLVEQGKIEEVHLDERIGGTQLPAFEIVNMRQERKQKSNSGLFSSVLLHALEQTLANKEQAILFQNRRGFATHMTCEVCGAVPQCKNCDVSLTYHLYSNTLTCHYCGYTLYQVPACHQCGSHQLHTMGYGTERIEDELKILLPEARIQRMDWDTTRKKKSYEQILADFSEQKTDILVGTQMVTKGLDFEHVRLVGIFDIDRLIHFPDFRSTERAFQVVTQVGGRAGRRDKQGKVVIQTHQPEHPIISWVQSADYAKFYSSEIRERKEFHYPPFTRLINVRLKHPDKATVSEAAKAFYLLATQQLGSHRVLEAHEPLISRLRNQYLMEILIKIEREGISLTKVKQVLSAIHEKWLQLNINNRKVGLAFDVDPY